MPQNIYDNQEFFEGYSRLRRSREGLEGAPEWPSLRAMLPAMAGLSVIDLGCGYGWFCRWAREAGAARVVGVDISEKMLERAQLTTHDDAITYRRADLESIDLPEGSFNLVYSSLTFHYIENLDRLFSVISRVLVPNGSFVFSVEHPIYTAPDNPAWTVDDAGRVTWPVNHYQDLGPRSTDWIAKGVVKQHRLISTYVNMLLGLGFQITRLEEWGPTHEQVALRPDLERERERPMFLLVGARR